MSPKKPLEVKGIVTEESRKPSQQAKKMKQRAGFSQPEVKKRKIPSQIHSSSSEESDHPHSTSQSDEEATNVKSPTTSPWENKELGRKGDEDEQRFLVPGSLERFQEAKERTILEEKRISMNGLRDNFPLVFEKVQYHRWVQFTNPLPKYNLALVREFYASYGATLPKKKKGQKQGFPNVVQVRGVNVRCGPNDINMVYAGEEPFESIDDYALKVHSDIESMRPWVASLIATGTPKWLGVGIKIYKIDLNVEARFWLKFVSSRLQPSQNDTMIPLEKAILIACIMDKSRINLGNIIYPEIGKKAQQKKTSLIFPCLITELCRRAGVPLMSGVDMEVYAVMVCDIMRVQDEKKQEIKRLNLTPVVDLEDLEDASVGLTHIEASVTPSHKSSSFTPSTLTGPFTHTQSPSSRPIVATTSSRLDPTLTHPSLIKLDQLAHITEANVAKLELQIPDMIKVAVSNIQHTYSEAFVGLSDRISKLEAGIVSDIKTIKVDISALKKEVDQMTWTNFDFFESIPDAEPALVEPLAPTIEQQMEGGQHEGFKNSPNSVISNAEKNKVVIAATHEKVATEMCQSNFKSLQHLEDIRIDAIIEVSQKEKSMVDTSDVTSDPLGVVETESLQQQIIHPLYSTSGLEPEMSNATLPTSTAPSKGTLSKGSDSSIGAFLMGQTQHDT